MLFIFELKRILKLIILSAISSLPFVVMQVIRIQPKIAMLIAFFVFLAFICYDAYTSPFDFWEERGVFSVIFVPYLALVILCYITYFFGESTIFNALFLPFRCGECIGIRTFTSLALVSLVVLGFTLALGLLGEHTAKKDYYENFYYEDTDIVFAETNKKTEE